MSTYENIRLAIDDRVARITFCRQPLNIFNIAMMKEINAALTTLSREVLVAIVFDADKDCRTFSEGVAVEDPMQEKGYHICRWAGIGWWLRTRHSLRHNYQFKAR